MRVITGIFVILAHLVAGNLLSGLIGGFMPGSVIGMVLLFITLRTGIVKEHWVRTVATFLTDNMTMFFMPANKVDEATQRDGLPYRIYAARGLLTISGENTVDYHDVEDWFLMLEKQYQILCQKIGYDRYSAAYLVQDLEADGYDMESLCDFGPFQAQAVM